MSKRLPQQQLTTLVFMMFEGLVDSQTNCCRASTVILNTLLKNRGGGLQDMVTHGLPLVAFSYACTVIAYDIKLQKRNLWNH